MEQDTEDDPSVEDSQGLSGCRSEDVILCSESEEIDIFHGLSESR